MPVAWTKRRGERGNEREISRVRMLLYLVFFLYPCDTGPCTLPVGSLGIYMDAVFDSRIEVYREISDLP